MCYYKNVEFCKFFKNYFIICVNDIYLYILNQYSFNIPKKDYHLPCLIIGRTIFKDFSNPLYMMHHICFIFMSEYRKVISYLSSLNLRNC